MRTPAWGLFPTSIMIWCDGGLERIGTAAQTRTPARTQCIASLRRLYSWMRQETHILSPRRYVYKLCEPLGEHGANTKKVILIKEGAKIKTSPALSASLRVSTGSPELAFRFSSLQKNYHHPSLALPLWQKKTKENKDVQLRDLHNNSLLSCRRIQPVRTRPETRRFWFWKLDLR